MGVIQIATHAITIIKILWTEPRGLLANTYKMVT